MKSRILVVAIALMVPAAAQAQQQSADARIDATLETAVEAGIPTTLLKSKIEEGRAKGVSEARIATAVETRLQALIKASTAMKEAKIESASESELSVAADAMQAGVSSKSLVKVYSDAPRERRAVAVAVLTDLVRLGKANEHALARVSAAVRSNAALANLQAEVASQLHGRGLGATLEGAAGLGIGRKQ